MTDEKNQFVSLDSRRLSVRLGLAAVLISVSIFAWLAIRWQLGNMLAEYTLPTDPAARNIAQSAVEFAPSDPLANWLFINTKKESATVSDDSIDKNFEKIIKLSPNDFRWWIELGRAQEQADNYQRAENSYLRAAELAPAYIYPRWQLGNFYLRQNRSVEGFNQLRKAAETDSTYRDQVISIAWDFFEKDTKKVEENIGDSPSVKESLAKFYAAKELPEDSLRIWNALSEENKQTNTNAAKAIMLALYDKRFYRQAIEFVRQLGIEPDAKHETVQNAGFEKPIGDPKSIFFGWKVSPFEKMDVKLDPTEKHEGSRSLRMSFSGYQDATLFNLYQVVTVVPKTGYRLSFWIRTENLQSAGAPTLEIYNTRDDKNIVTSQPFPVGTNDWRQVKMDFTAPDNCEAVAIRTTRAFCGVGCPIIGAFWYDDFKFEKLR